MRFEVAALRARLSEPGVVPLEARLVERTVLACCTGRPAKCCWRWT
jgi:hypothetical protein